MSNFSNYTRDLSYAEPVRSEALASAEQVHEKWPGWARIAFIVASAGLLWGGIIWALSTVF
jgi:hypothetical protein